MNATVNVADCSRKKVCKIFGAFHIKAKSAEAPWENALSAEWEPASSKRAAGKTVSKKKGSKKSGVSKYLVFYMTYFILQSNNTWKLEMCIVETSVFKGSYYETNVRIWRMCKAEPKYVGWGPFNGFRACLTGLRKLSIVHCSKKYRAHLSANRTQNKKLCT